MPNEIEPDSPEPENDVIDGDPQAVTSVSEYFNALAEVDIDSATAWYRGVVRSDWPLVPSLYREKVPEGFDDARKLEVELLNQFVARSGPFVDSQVFGSQTFTAGHDSGMKWAHYVAMQHYGLPTRLLDWTENALIALYFSLYPQQSSRCESCETPISKCAACLESGIEPPGGAVWVLDPGAWNSRANMPNHGAVSLEETADNYKVGSLIMNPAPAAVIAQTSNPRILAQRGMFTIHGEEETPLDERAKSFGADGRGLAQIKISAEHADSLRTELDRIGLMQSMVFPDLPSVCIDIRRRILS